MSEGIINLCWNLLRLAEAQREALSEGRLEEALELQERRQSIVDRIQRIDRNIPSSLQTSRSSVGKNDPQREDFSHRIEIMIEKILSLDRDMQAIIQSELTSISDKLHTIQKVKAFCLNTIPHKTWGRLHISI